MNDAFYLKLRILFVNPEQTDIFVLCPIPRFQAIFLNLFAFYLLAFERGSNLKDLFSSNDTVGVSTTETKSKTLVSLLTASLVALNMLFTLTIILQWHLFQENCVASTKGSQAKEQNTCQVGRETGEDVSFESRFIGFLCVFKIVK